MLSLLSRIFIKNHRDYSNPKVRHSYGMLTGIVGISLNILLFAGKYFAGVISGSVAVRADAFNNLSDAGSSCITLLGFLFAGKKPDPDHPFGHGRIEYISGLGVSVMIILMGIELFKSSVVKLIHPQELEVGLLTMAVLIVSVGVKVYMAVYNTSIGKKIDSAAMKATATDSLSDCIATMVVFLCMLLYYFTGINLDGISGIVVAVFIILAGISAAKETLSPLLGEAPNEEFVKDIEKAVMEHEMVSGIHDMIVHDYGPGRVMVSLHAEVPGNLDIYSIHDEIDLIERELKGKFMCDVVIHMDPIAVDDEKIGTLRKQVALLARDIDAEFTIHDFRLVEGPSHTNLIFDMAIPYGYPKSDDEVIKQMQQLIHGKWENYFAVINIDKKHV